MIEKITKEAKGRMQKSVEALGHELSRLRTGRAHPSLLEQIKVDYYGNDAPLNQVANIAIEDARTLSVTPWEKDMIPKIEKAIIAADLGLNPNTAGVVIRVPLPALTEERRKDLARLVRDEAEKARVAVRNIRREANNSFKELIKVKSISEDDERRAGTQIQKLTDDFIAQIDDVAAKKEKDLMAI